MVEPFYDTEFAGYEIGIDEVGRGPMFGRVYSGAVVLPKEGFDYSAMKDSKKFTSKKKLAAAAEYIKTHALYWAVSWENETTIDKINIRQATFKAMHQNVKKILEKINIGGKFTTYDDIFLLVDGHDFKPYTIIDGDCFTAINHDCVKGGDNKYASIAAASILAKVERDNYILELCEKYPVLCDRYGLDGNKGYGAKRHMDGIREHGITQWHRKSFGICKTADFNPVS